MAAASLAAQSPIQGNGPFPAHNIVGNIYYVGADDIASFLITTPSGHILINAGYAETVPIIENGIKKLGFNPGDVKILLNGQAHYDHVAGMAALQKLTGGKVYSSQRDAPVLESGGVKDPRWGKEQTYPPVKVDHILRDNEKITLGGTTLITRLTPGHSMGCTTFTVTVNDGGKPLEVVFVGGTSINPGVHFVGKPTWPGIAEDFQKGLDVLKSLKCDVFLGAHGGYYGMNAKYGQIGKGANPYIDPAGYRAFVEKSEKTFHAQLASEKAAAK
ncbi:MAG: Beta-lactamase [Bryobacterales bacterium]|nr:Beta-lactamase [Bryobacterales bacterium]